MKLFDDLNTNNARHICTVLESGWLQENTRFPSAIDKIRELETPRLRAGPEVEPMFCHPTFTQHLNNVQLSEKGTAVFECKVEPSKDPSLRIGNRTDITGFILLCIE